MTSPYECARCRGPMELVAGDYFAEEVRLWCEPCNRTVDLPRAGDRRVVVDPSERR